MKNYKDSDYAVNKFSPNIVYRFATGVVEISLENYLRSNPNKIAEDFANLKAISDEIYHEQSIDTNRTSRLDISVHDLEETSECASLSLEDELCQKQEQIEQQKKHTAIRAFMKSDALTDIQKKRLILHHCKKMTTAQIALLEGKNQNAVWKSIHAAEKKVKRIFAKWVVKIP